MNKFKQKLYVYRDMDDGQTKDKVAEIMGLYQVVSLSVVPYFAKIENASVDFKYLRYTYSLYVVVQE